MIARALTIALATTLALSACKSKPEATQDTPKEATQAQKEAPKAQKADPKAQRVGEEPRAQKEAPKELTKGELWTPAAFAAQWAKVFTMPDDHPQKEAYGEKLSKHWEGKKLQWTGYAMASLCLSQKKRCSVNTFERTKVKDLQPLGGFFPLVDFGEAGWQKLREGCKDQKQCVVTFTGVLTKVITEPGRPLALTFSDATVQETRQPLAEEKWFGREPTAKKKTDAKPGSRLRTGKATPIKLNIKTKTF